MRLQGTIALYVRGGTTQDTEFPGDSDIDIILLMADLTPEVEEIFFRKLTKKCSFLSSLFPFFQHIDVFNVESFKLYFPLRQLQSLPPFRFYANYSDGQRIITSHHNVKITNSNLLSLILKKYRDLTQELLAFPSKKLLRHFIKRTNYIAEWASQINGLNKDKDIGRLKEQNTWAKKMRYRVPKINNFTLETWSITNSVLKSLCRCEDSYRDKEEIIKLDGMSIAQGAIKQKSQNKAREGFQAFINKLGQYSSQIESIILSSQVGSNYQYFLYIILADSLKEKTEQSLIEHVIKTYAQSKKEFQDYIMENHIILPKSCFNFCIQHTLLPGGYLESLHMFNNAVTLYGNDLIKNHAVCNILNKTPVMTKWDFINNILLSPPIAANPFKNLIFAINLKDRKRAIASLDTILGELPAKRLFLESNIITTTPEETFYQYTHFFRDEPETETYKKLYSRFYTNPPQGINLFTLNQDLHLIYQISRKNTAVIETKARDIAQRYTLIC